jgi:hypothetical protein
LLMTGYFKEHAFLTKQIFNVISTHLGKLSLKETGAGSSSTTGAFASGSNLTYLISTDYIPITSNNEDSFVIYQGSHLPVVPVVKGLTLPTATYVEHISTYLNLEGRVRTSKIALASPPLVLSDTEVLRLLNILKVKAVYHNMSFLQNFYAVTGFFKFIIDYKCCFFGTLNKFLEEFVYISGFKLRAFSQVDLSLIKPSAHYCLKNTPAPLALSSQFLTKVSTNYYSMDTLSRNSKIMGLCSTRLVFSTFS